MIKLFIDKTEEIASIIEKIIKAAEEEVVIVIPRAALVKESMSNFHLIKREAAAAGKSILIESVDEEILAFSQAADIEAIHPLFRRSGSERAVSDIVASGAPNEFAAALKEKSIAKKGKKVKPKEIIETVEVELPKEEKPRLYNPQTFYSHEANVAPERIDRPEYHSSAILPSADVHEEGKKPFFRRPIVLGFFGIIVLGLIGVWVVAKFFGSVQVTVVFKTTPWESTQSITASKTVSAASAQSSTIPAEVFSQKRTIAEPFPATGVKKSVSQKAAVRIVIVNEFGTDPQSLVATTRFMTPDGKIFRLNTGVIIPGATKQNGKLASSSIEALVTADAPGPSYNVQPAERLTIPGLKGSPKYEGFYATMKEPATGGFLGERPTVTDLDIAKAKEKINTVLKGTFQTDILNKLPKDFMILEGAREFKITTLSPNKNVDE